LAQVPALPALDSWCSPQAAIRWWAMAPDPGLCSAIAQVLSVHYLITLSILNVIRAGSTTVSSSARPNTCANSSSSSGSTPPGPPDACAHPNSTEAGHSKELHDRRTISLHEALFGSVPEQPIYDNRDVDLSNDQDTLDKTHGCARKFMCPRSKFNPKEKMSVHEFQKHQHLPPAFRSGAAAMCTSAPRCSWADEADTLLGTSAGSPDMPVLAQATDKSPSAATKENLGRDNPAVTKKDAPVEIIWRDEHGRVASIEKYLALPPEPELSITDSLDDEEFFALYPEFDVAGKFPIHEQSREISQHFDCLAGCIEHPAFPEKMHELLRQHPTDVLAPLRAAQPTASVQA